MEDLPAEILEFMSEGEDEVEDSAEFSMDWGCVVVVDNVPEVTQEKHEKLKGVLKKIFGQMGKIISLVMPMEAGKTIGIAFVEFEKAEEASKAVRLADNYVLDKFHAFKVSPYSTLQALADLKEEWEPSPKPPFEPRLNPHSWLADPSHRDQFALRYNNETEIRWVERSSSPSLDYGGEREKEGGKYWCEMYVKWSPQGSLLATFHRPGIALWGDANFSKQGRFAHAGVKTLEFSPKENYMMTSTDGREKRGIVIWDLRSRREIRSFEVVRLPQFVASTHSPSEGPPPPLVPAPFSWSFDDSYCARRAKDKSDNTIISIYQLPAMTLLDKKSLKADGVVDFQWSPSKNVLAYWAPEQANTPARVTIVEIPSRKELRQKNLVNVSDCKIFWHPDGKYLCVKVLRHTKSKKTTFTSLELFRVEEPLVPVEMMEMKTDVVAFAWEPNGGHRFAVVHGGPSAKKSVTFYSMRNEAKKSDELCQLFTLENRLCNALFWSPVGGHVVLAGLGDGLDGKLEFFDVDNKFGKEVEHYRATQVAWDPSGRIVATSVVQPLEGTFYKFQMDNGYKLWSFQGNNFHDSSFENMYQLSWRPRPKSLLDADRKKHIIKNLRKYERKFAHEDKLKDLDRQRELTTEKRATRREYRRLLELRKRAYYDSKHVRIRMRNGFDADADENYVVTTKYRDILVSTKEELVQASA